MDRERETERPLVRLLLDAFLRSNSMSPSDTFSWLPYSGNVTQNLWPSSTESIVASYIWQHAIDKEERLVSCQFNLVPTTSLTIVVKHMPYRRLVVLVCVHGADLHAGLQELDDRQVGFLALLFAAVQEKLRNTR